MDTENNSSKFKILIGILSILLIGLAVYTVTLYNDSKNTVSGLEQQKSEIEKELESLITNYDEVIQDNELKDKDLLAARERIEILLDSVKNSEANVALIGRYKAEIGKLKEERKMLFKRADSLINANQRLALERDSTTNVLTKTYQVVDSFSQKNTAMAETIKKGSAVSATDLRGEAVIVRNNGKIVDTRRSSRADKVRACFTLAPNSIAEKGDKLLFVQVINPKNNLLGDKESIDFGENELSYSASTKVFYENDELDVCILVNAAEEDLIEGRYVINVFDGPRQIATATMELK
jgi:cell division protein FtsB